MAIKDAKPEDQRDDSASIEALKLIITALDKLSEPDRHRVLEYAVEFFNVYMS